MGNYTMPENVTGMVDLIDWTAETVGGDFFGGAILLAFFLVVFLSTKKTETKKAFAVAGFMTALIGVMMRALGLITDRVVIIAIVVAGAALFWLVLDRT